MTQRKNQARLALREAPTPAVEESSAALGYHGLVEGDSIELVNRLCDGDRSALELLLERHMPRLRGYVRLNSDRQLRLKEDSTDIVQSVCRELLENAERFQHPSENAFRHWLYSTALRKIRRRYHYYRAQKRDVDREVAIDGGGPSNSGERQVYYADLVSPSTEAAARETQEKIERAFEQLPDDYREVLLMAQVVGMTRGEIGAELGKTEVAVRSLLFRARARLGALLSQAGVDP